MVRIRDVTHEGLAAVELVHAGMRLIAIHELGPRIAWFGRAGGDNLLYWDPTGAERRGPWTLRGGHRLWLTRPLADETEETYTPDDAPCRVRRLVDGVALTAPPDPHRLEKTLVIRAAPRGFAIDHRLRNASDLLWSGGLWALTCTRPRRGVHYGVPLGGDGSWDVFAIVVPRRWAGHTSRVADPQLQLGEDCLVVRPRGVECKRMIQAPRGLIGMTAGDLSFVKHAPYDEAATYPLATNVAFYVAPDNRMVELETMGPIRTLAPGATLRHVETWRLVAAIDWARWRPPVTRAARVA